jgi:hypothetical protein
VSLPPKQPLAKTVKSTFPDTAKVNFINQTTPNVSTTYISVIVRSQEELIYVSTSASIRRGSTSPHTGPLFKIGVIRR